MLYLLYRKRGYKMKEFKIPVEWACYGVVTINAKSLDEAINIAKEDENIPLPESNYINDSWKVNNEDMDFIHFLNNI